MCRAKGVGGVIADDIDPQPILDEADSTLARYAGAAPLTACFPAELSDRLRDRFVRQSNTTRNYAGGVLGDAPRRSA